MDTHLMNELFASVVGFMAGVGATVTYGRIKGYEIASPHRPDKDKPCGS